MLALFAPGSPAIYVYLAVCFVLVLVFEFSNGFHDTANAVATVIYTHSLKPVQAVVWSGLMNFAGVLIGGIAVAFALVELIPPEVLSPPDGGVAVGMLAAVFVSALVWNVGTWWFGIPNSSSHALIGALIGIAIENSLRHARGLANGIDWQQILSVLGSLLISPLLGFGLALGLYKLIQLLVHDKHLYEPPREGQPPIWWMRGLLILTCTGVSFSHGTNDGQKSIGLIMLTIIGLLPASYSLNLDLGRNEIASLRDRMPAAATLIGTYGDDRKDLGVAAAHHLGDRLGQVTSLQAIPDRERAAVRNDVNLVVAELKAASENKAAPKADKANAEALHGELMKAVQFAPWWVRVLSALCLGAGTMIGYKRIVTTLGERLGNQHLAPAQGAAAEVVAAGLIGVAGFTGFPVSTTHVVTGGIAGTMVASGAGVQAATLRAVAAAWVLTLPATIAISAGLFHILS